MSRPTPPNFPSDIELYPQDFKNWSWNIDVPDLWTCAPRTADDVVTVCNWAKDNEYVVRPRAIMHGWSPLSVIKDTSKTAKIIMMDTTKYLTSMSLTERTASTPPQVTVGVGATSQMLLEYLKQQPGGQGPAPGYCFSNTPAPGHLTVGGMLAINAHGTSIPAATEPTNAAYGSLSNLILSFTAVVTDPSSSDPSQYRLKTFTRGEGDDRAFLAHLGRAFLVEVTLQVIDNYNLRCQSIMDISYNTLFQQPTEATPVPDNSFADFLNQSGRVEAIWFPFSENPWLKVWTRADNKPASSREVTAPYNYPFSDNLPDWVTTLLKQITSGFGGVTPAFGKATAWFTNFSLQTSDATDLWGEAMNTLLYVKDTTLRVTANGYAIQMNKSNVQRGVYEFTQKYLELLHKYEAQDLYPINSPVEIRVTSLDNPQAIQAPNGQTAESPTLSSLSQDAVSTSNNWDVALWVDILTLPGTPASNDFYQELEEWIFSNFTGDYARPMPEWSKGWAYSSDGAWTNNTIIEKIRTLYTDGRIASNTWSAAEKTLDNYDRYGLFRNPFIDQLFQPE